MKDIRGKSFLITGGTGFLGKNMQPFLTSLGAEVIVVGSRFDLATESGAEKALSTFNKRFDYIIHGAAVQAAGDWPLRHKAEQYHLNLHIHTNTFAMWKQHQPQAKMIGIGSSCSYPGTKEVLKEAEYWDGPMHDSVDIYGFTKKALSVGIEAYKSQYGLKGTTVIFATLYGPHDHFDPEKSHVVSALVKKFVDARRANDPTVEVWGDGTQTRELIYVEDQIKGLLAVLDYEGPIINIGTGVSTAISELAETLKAISHYKGGIVYNTNRFVGIKRKVLDISLAKEKYGWTTDVPIDTLENNLTKTVSYYESISPGNH
ncbi:MAG: NAD-dependent epimerase/dehydratase family protein [Limisphaerales bacterium]